MKKDAEAHADEDKKVVEAAEAHNLADQIVYTAEKALKDNGDKISDEIKKDVQEKIDALKTARSATDTAAITAGIEALSTSMQKIGEVMAQANQDTTPENTSSQDAPDASAEGENKENT